MGGAILHPVAGQDLAEGASFLEQMFEKILTPELPSGILRESVGEDDQTVAIPTGILEN